MKLIECGVRSPRNRAALVAPQVACKLPRILAVAAMLLAISSAALLPLPARASEHALAGIHIFASYKEVMHVYGQPTQILTGAAAIQGPSVGANTSGQLPGGTVGPNQFGPSGAPGKGAPGMFGAPGAGGTSPMGMPPGMPAGIAMRFGGRMGGVPGLGAPAGAVPGASGLPTSASQVGGIQSGVDTSVEANEVRYVYQRSNGTVLEFLLSPDGNVIQIDLLGYKATSKTARGVMLGSSYSLVTDKYGYPETQDSTAGMLTLNYLQKENVSFKLRDNKVIGITVVAAA